MEHSDVEHWQKVSTAYEKLYFPDHYPLRWTQQTLLSTKPGLSRIWLALSCSSVQMLLFAPPHRKEYRTQRCQISTED